MSLTPKQKLRRQSVRFELDCECLPKQAGKRGIARVGTRSFPSKVLATNQQTMQALMMPHRLAEPMRGPVALTMHFCYPWLKKHTARQRAEGRIYKATRPDMDNLAKNLCDVLESMRFVENDSQFCFGERAKWFDGTQRIVVRMWELETEK